MRGFFILAALCLLSTGSLLAQNTTTLNINIANTNATSCIFITHNGTDYKREKIILDKSHSGTYQFNITHPQFYMMMCLADTATVQKGFGYTFFITPGDKLIFKADFDKADDGIFVAGKGSNNNQPLIASLEDINLEAFRGDSIPNRAIAAINKQQRINVNSLNKYINTYKPTPAFVKNWGYNIAYTAPAAYYIFKENNNKFGPAQAAYKRNIAKWQKIQDSLFATIKLNNDAALSCPHYIRLIQEFSKREREHLWTESNEYPEKFYREWYNSNVTDGQKLLNDDRTNLLEEKIINKYFTGQTLEFLYANLFEKAIGEGDFKNISSIFNRFSNKYPNSAYVKKYTPAINNIIAKQKKALNDKMIFAADNGLKINNLTELLALTKGKTVLVDMWGTWCGPCREEITANSASIKAYFKDKGLNYLYIANFDIGNENNWKKLIAYFNLEGTHVLANNQLTEDIMAKVKGTGYPTYFIIKKDGSYELSKAGYPMKRQVLITQLEAALAL